MKLRNYFILSLALTSVCLCAADLSSDFDIDVTLTNDHDKDFTDLPVVLQIFRVFGRGVDYTRFNPKGFHVLDEKGAEVPLSIRPVPPDFSLANDEIVVVLPKFAKGQTLKFRYMNTKQNNAAQAAYDPAKLFANANNLIPNGGFENGNEGWDGGTVVQDAHSGKNALMLETPGAGGHAKAQCTKSVNFAKGKNYYFGLWAKCENVTRRTWRYSQSWALTPISGRISFSNNPLVFPEFADGNHLIRLMDDRPWYCYEANAIATLCTPQPAVNGGASNLQIALDQENMPNLDANKPARILIDDVLLFEQPQVEISWSRTEKKLAPDGFFLYRRAATCLDEPLYAVPHLPAPRPYEKIASLSDTAALGERKTVMLGIKTAAPIQNLSIDVSDLKGSGSAMLGEAARDIEFSYTPTQNFKFDGTSLEGWVIDGNAPRNIDRPGFVDYIISFRVPTNAAPGKYSGTVKVKGNGKDLGQVPLELEVVNLPLKVITDKFAGLIYNAGMSCTDYRFAPGYDKTNGAVLPGRDENFLKYYARCNLTYMMMFCGFLPFKGESADVDIAQLTAQMKQMRDVAGCTAGVGLYQDCSLDKQGNNKGPDGGHGLWPRSKQNPDVFRARVKEMDGALAQAGLPPLVYMIWDEPRFCDANKFGILKGTGANTTSDINYRECCEQLQKGLFTAASVDGPGCDYGPAMRKFAAKCGQKIGFDSYAGPFCHRYQTGMMLANGAATASFWHIGYYMGFHQAHKTFVRGANMIGLGEGMIDLRYFETLQDTIAEAKKKNAAKQEVEAAEKYLKEVLDFCTDDFHFMSEIEVYTYNGGAERWGDDWFYDHWRSELRRHTLAILQKLKK